MFTSMIMVISIVGAPTTGYIENNPYMVGVVDRNPTEARIGVALFTVAVGCLKGGIGTDQQSFWDGCWQGAIGGAVSAAGMEIASYAKYDGLGALGKLVNDAGISIQDNVAMDIGMFDRFQTDIGPLQITYHDGFEFGFTVLPVAGVAAQLSLNGHFNVSKSLSNLTMVFDYQDTCVWSKEAPILFCGIGKGSIKDTLVGEAAPGGISIGNTIGYVSDQPTSDKIFSHEFNHSIYFSNFRLGGEVLKLGPWNVGQDLSYALLGTLEIGDALYYNNPLEIIAVSMERN